MTDDFPKYRNTISLIPGGPLQFLDLGFNINDLPKISEAFWEYDAPHEDGRTIWYLQALAPDPDRVNGWLDRVTQKPATDPRTDTTGPGSGRLIREPLYTLNAQKAVEPFLDQWIPLPILRLARRTHDTDPEFRNGPTNWCRARLSRLSENHPSRNTHALTVVFDTAVEGDEADQFYAALCKRDVREGGEFALASKIEDNSWFLDREWIREWLKELFLESIIRHRRRRVKQEELAFKVEHLGRYLTFLTVLRESKVLPRIRVVDPSRSRPVEVDLVLDIGNSRTCGMIVERPENETPNISNSSRLELRDLTEPLRRYREPYGSNLAFGKIRFGDPNDWSLMSYRQSTAFAWPSVVRVGPEAQRIALRSRCDEGQTSMSSPKRYLWDRDPPPLGWRYCPDATGLLDSSDPPEDPVTTGLFVMYVNNEGTPIEALLPTDAQEGHLPPWDHTMSPDQSPDPVTEPLFSRSSMMMFMLGEIIAHALVQINAPAQRGDRQNSDIPRQLRNIILTMPPAMTIAERKIFTQWAGWAVDTVWRAIGWESQISRSDPDFRRCPDVRSDWDEASTTQLVWLYNEIAERFSGDVSAYFELRGRRRPDVSKRHSLRVASIDIGGGTTDLIITTYKDESVGATGVVEPKQEFREGFNVAGDQILKEVIENHVITGLRAALEYAGMFEAKEFLERHLAGDHSRLSDTERNLRAQFANQVAVPLGLHILRLSESTPMKDANSEPVLVRYSDVLSDAALEPNPAVVGYIDEAAMRHGASGFGLVNLELTVDLAEVAATIITVIHPILVDLSELVEASNSDVLLLSGRPSCLPAVQTALLIKPPVPAGGFVPLSGYKVGAWYPFWSPGGRIADPKTTAAVGAVLCTLAEGSLQNFHFKTKLLRPASTARFIGQMDSKGQIQNDNLLFRDLDLDGNRDEEIAAVLPFSAPCFVGFRQLPLERWKVTPFYYLKFSGTQAGRNAQGRLPYQVKLTYRRKLDDGDVDWSHEQKIDEGAFVIDEIIAADEGIVYTTELTLQLKTMKEDAGHWLDTGMFQIR